MKQKTFYSADKYAVGDKVLLIGRQRENGGKEIFSGSKKYAETGYPGNMNSSIYRFHGWRGTSYGVSTCVYGVRNVEAVEATGKVDEYGNTIYKIQVGKGIHPEYD